MIHCLINAWQAHAVYALHNEKRPKNPGIDHDFWGGGNEKLHLSVA